jgi:hypothetical protein
MAGDIRGIRAAAGDLHVTVARHGERPCDHLHDTVSRYDHAAKRLELLLTCPVCETEKVIHSLVYEPRFDRP